MRLTMYVNSNPGCHAPTHVNSKNDYKLQPYAPAAPLSLLDPEGLAAERTNSLPKHECSVARKPSFRAKWPLILGYLAIQARCWSAVFTSAQMQCKHKAVRACLLGLVREITSSRFSPACVQQHSLERNAERVLEARNFGQDHALMCRMYRLDPCPPSSQLCHLLTMTGHSCLSITLHRQSADRDA